MDSATLVIIVEKHKQPQRPLIGHLDFTEKCDACTHVEMHTGNTIYTY